MYSSAKDLVSRRAPRRHSIVNKHREERANQTDEEKKEEQETLNNSVFGKGLNWYLDNIAKPVENYIDSRVENFKEILDNGDGNLFQGIINTTIKDLGKGISSAEQAVNETLETYFPSLVESSGNSGASAKPIVYSDWTPASKLFGMDQATAFGEHMVNTAHQREVADLKAAGLNPVLGISGSGSSSVSGNMIASSSAEKAQEFPWMDVLGATAGLITTLVSKKPALGYMVSNVFKSFD